MRWNRQKVKMWPRPVQKTTVQSQPDKQQQIQQSSNGRAQEHWNWQPEEEWTEHPSSSATVRSRFLSLEITCRTLLHEPRPLTRNWIKTWNCKWSTQRLLLSQIINQGVFLKSTHEEVDNESVKEFIPVFSLKKKTNTSVTVKMVTKHCCGSVFVGVCWSVYYRAS